MAERRPIVNPSDFAEHVNTDTLNVGQGPVFVEQASSLATPASGYGVVYAKTDGKLYFKNDAGTETDLTATGCGGGGTDPVIREYTSNDTWTVPTAANFWGAMIIAVGAGGGGGSGARRASTSVRSGGSGAGGGVMTTRLMRSAALTLASYAVTIGAGGTGGAAQTADDTNGNNGASGGTTSVGSIVIALPGSGSSGGRTVAVGGGAGGAANNSTPAYGPFSKYGGNGAAALTT